MRIQLDDKNERERKIRVARRMRGDGYTDRIINRRLGMSPRWVGEMLGPRKPKAISSTPPLLHS